ncbi:hypothetical protein LTR91_009365 [Friedmanniomyces endolithicus]|uniref:Uncharacterized protein n=1 Tax=Friedmanniomyces endolithicus TaxID=329885 RepID=A0A4U0UYV1_9PEZI|nr:hypothetical protein LTS09_001831 [Friedmanniomyces endolithicus]KAK0288298.1 hypothetical protein LTR35_003772 [Friedmanniomyces endolithicus]KAK0289924.1 hypothetical protein LTS00_009061 [Friedmanniomyces endolithicus]KAK0326105.1 hypothetical protein LTR82_002850 [Friedmanniomyces endolithicus]KAK0925534.1 hypothetical protein LTR57_004835 [Friedmanniomyces endolithicus]
MKHYCFAAANSPTKFANFREDFFDSKDEVDEPVTPHDGLICTFMVHEDLVKEVGMTGVTTDTGGYAGYAEGSLACGDNGFGGACEGMQRSLRFDNQKKTSEGDPFKVRSKCEVVRSGSLLNGDTPGTSTPTLGHEYMHGGSTAAAKLVKSAAATENDAEQVAEGAMASTKTGDGCGGGLAINDGYMDGWLVLQATVETTSDAEDGEERGGELEAQGDYVDGWLRLR